MTTPVKWVLGCGLALLVVAVACGVAFFAWVSSRPRTWTVEETIDISAPPEDVAALVADLRSWQNWSAWERDVSSEVPREFAEPSAGSGASMSWGGTGAGVARRIEIGGGGLVNVKFSSGSDQGAVAGRGRVVIKTATDALVEIEATHEGRLRLNYSAKTAAGSRSGSFSFSADERDFVLRSDVRFDPAGDGTRVIWREHGDLGEGFSAGLVAASVLGKAGEAHSDIVRLSLKQLKHHIEEQR